MTRSNTAAKAREGDAPPDPESLANFASDLIEQARRAGADQADAHVTESRSLEVSVRDGALEDVERSESRDAGLRVIVGKRQAGVAFSDLSAEGCALAVERAVAMAKAAPEDPWCGLAEPGDLASALPDIPLYEPLDFDPDALERMALEMEAAALAIDSVETTAGGGASLGVGASAFATSHGFLNQRMSSSCGLGIAPVARRDGAMERDHESHSARRLSELKSPKEIGRIAGERAAARLGSEKLPSGRQPVVFDRREATAFLSALFGAISGPAIARGTSFLRDKMGERVFAEGINIVEDPLRPWGLGSRACDAEGVATKPRALIEDGVLTTWLLNAASARQLGLDLSGHAARRLGAPPGAGPSNVHLAAGDLSRDDLIAEAGEGLLVTEMFGPSLNPNTGDWSVGVAGFRISGGKIAGPVSEVTVAGNLLEMFQRLTPGSDLEFDSAINSPSVLVEGLSVGGQ